MPMPDVNPQKTRSIRRLGNVDIAELRAAVLNIPESVWESENAAKPNPFNALEDAQHIVFRFVDDFRDWRRSHDREPWARWRQLLLPVMESAVAPYAYATGAFPRVMFARMPPGGAIAPHKDLNPAARWPHKIHVPILTNERVTFFVEGVRYHFAEGEAVEVNNLGIHAASNEGSTDRVHLIFEYFEQS